MADLMTEEEQIIALKVWWKRYGWFVTGGIVAGLVVYLGWSIWQTREQDLRAEASYHYETMVENLIAGDQDAVDKQVTNTENVSLSMPYALLEQWMLAEVAVKQEKFEQAISHLQEGLALATDSFFQELTRVRLARLYLAQNNPQRALEIVALEKDEQANKNPEVFLVRGDAYLALQDNAKAREAYTKAWQLYPMTSPERQIVAMFLAEVPAETIATHEQPQTETQ